MGEQGCLHSRLLDGVEIHTREEIQTVNIGGIVGDGVADGVVLDRDNGLKEVTHTVLDILAEGVQVGREHDRCGEDTALILTLGLAVELLPPLVEHGGVELVAHEDLGGLALAVENVAQGGVLVGIVLFNAGIGVSVHSISRALHERGDVDACHSDGEKSHGGEHREASADVIRHDEGLIACLIREVLEGTARLVGGDEDALARALLAVLLLQQCTEHAEGHGGLGGGARLRNDVDADVLALADLQKLVNSGGTDAVACEVDIGGILGEVVIEGGLQKLDDGACTEVGTTDTDGNEYVAGLLDLLCGDLNTCELFLIVILGESGPAKEVVARAGALHEELVRDVNLGLDIFQLLIRDKGSGVTGIQTNGHCV